MYHMHQYAAYATDKYMVGTPQIVHCIVYEALDLFIDIFFVLWPWCRIYAPVNGVSVGSNNGLSHVRPLASSEMNADL